MKPLSTPAAQLLAQLNVPSSWRERIGGDQRKVRALTALLEHARPSIVPHIAPLVFARPSGVRRAAELAMDRAFAMATPADLVELDKMCRQNSPYPAVWGDEWDTLSPLRLSVLEKFGSVGLGGLGLASFHANGYVREAAVRYLDARSEGQELAFLLVRLNDWVAPVAMRARNAIERRIVPSYTRAWLASLPLLLRLGSGTRRRADDLTDRVLGILGAPEQRHVLLAELSTGTRLTKRFALRLLSELPSDSETREEIFTLALRDRDTVLRLQAVAYARNHLSDAELERSIPRLLGDRYSPVRRAAVNAAAERLGEPAKPWLLTSLLDPGSTVREVARYHLERRGEHVDFASHYRRELGVASTPSHLAAAAAGLGDTGTPADIELLVPLLTHDRAGVRRAAARALASLDLDGQAARLLSVVDDASPGVARVARNALHRRSTVIDAKAVRNLIKNAAHPHGRLGGIALAATLSKWESLPLLLEAAASPDDDIRGAATQRIAVWLAEQNQSFAAPSLAQVEASRAALVTHGTTLAPRTREALVSVLDYWASH